jgi:hypothetical protein
MTRLVLGLMILAASTDGKSELIVPPPEMRAVMWVDDDSRFWRLNFMTMQIEPCGEDCSRNLADNWKGCFGGEQ